MSEWHQCLTPKNEKKQLDGMQMPGADAGDDEDER